ncbi:hypothetical protein [Microbacterium sp. NPDC087665]|uniref:hypothetical protein n=1 Tax=Microbacterium sp. NPDC087665 TaxID=3364194 RepID=UPI0038284102
MTLPENGGQGDLDDDVDETVILTRRDRRRAGEQDAAATASAEASDEVDEATVVVDRSARSTDDDVDEATVVVNRAGRVADDAVDESTVVVDRSRRAAQEPADETVDESTVMIDRSGSAVHEQVDESTVVIDRSRSAETPEEKTVVVARAGRGLLRRRLSESDPIDDSVQEDTVPRGSVSFERPAVAAPSIYKPRPAPLSPSAPPVVHGSAAPTRVENPDLLSVAKQGARWSRYTLLAFGGACVVSLVGLVSLGFLVFG